MAMNMNIWNTKAALHGIAVLLAVSSILLSGGCSKRAVAIDVPGDEGEFISFTGLATKAGAGDSITDTDSEMRTRPFGIFGHKRIEESDSPSNVFISTAAQEVGWGTEGSGADARQCWTYTPKRKWEMAMHYSFRAYWPYDAGINPASDAKRLAIEYKATTEDYDLLVAYATRYPQEDAEGISAVTMNFRHALSGLRFRIRYKNDASTSGLTDYVNSFHLKGLYTVGTLEYGQFSDTDDVEKIAWYKQENTFDSTGELYTWSGHERFHSAENATDTDETASVFDGEDKVVFVIPQTLSSGKGPTTANFYTDNGGDALHSVTLPTTELEVGKIYTFTFIIHSSYVTISIDIAEWDEIQSNVDINL